MLSDDDRRRVRFASIGLRWEGLFPAYMRLRMGEISDNAGSDARKRFNEAWAMTILVGFAVPASLYLAVGLIAWKALDIEPTSDRLAIYIAGLGIVAAFGFWFWLGPGLERAARATETACALPPFQPKPGDEKIVARSRLVPWIFAATPLVIAVLFSIALSVA